MLNQYVNLSPQQQMARALQQQGDQTQLQGTQQAQTLAPQNPFSGAQDAMSMYGKMSQQNNMQDMQDYLARLKLGQSQTGGMFNSANSTGPDATANNYTG
jgi:hypothetical protein